MAPISKKRAAIDMQGYHPLMNGLNNGLTGYSSDSSNQGSSETSNSSSNNVNLNNLTSNALNLHENSHSLGLSALQSLSALGISHPAQLTSQLSALHGLGPSQMLSNLSSLSGLGAVAGASSSSNSNNSVASSNGMDSMSKQYAKVNRVVLDKNSDEYRRRRERNNLAVKKSRTKSKLKTLQTLERVKQLKAENEDLQQKIDILTKELRLLKDLFMMHAHKAHGAEISEFDLALLTNCNNDVSQDAVPLNLNSKFSFINPHIN